MFGFAPKESLVTWYGLSDQLNQWFVVFSCDLAWILGNKCSFERTQYLLAVLITHLRPQNLSVDETPCQEDLRKVLRGRLPFPHQGCTRPQKYAHDHYRGDQTHSETDLGCPREAAAGSVPRHLAKFVVGHEAPGDPRLGKRAYALAESEPDPPPFLSLALSLPSLYPCFKVLTGQ